MGMFDNCFTWKRGANWVGCAAVIVLFIGGIFTIFDLSATCTAAAGLMIVMSFIIGALEAPPIVALCGIGEGFAKRLECIKGWWRALVYVLLSFVPVALCQGASAILAMLLLFTSGFFHFLDWLGPRGGQTKVRTQMNNEGLLPNDDDDDEEAFSNTVPQSQSSFMDQVTDKAGKAVAAAAVTHMKQQMAETFNPWGKSDTQPPASKPNVQPPARSTTTTTAPTMMVPTTTPPVEQPLGNPFATAPYRVPSPDLDNPFSTLNKA
eukprot:m.137749 g.137749  ORF g.137749 m.137749 type:complete len:264 (+) comp29942_c1_seq1:487-1278(+)